MRIEYYPDYVALNGRGVYTRLLECMQKTDHITTEYGDSAVIWSVLWANRMKPNHSVWSKHREMGNPVIVCEVGAITRNHTWKLSANGINRHSIWPEIKLDHDRPTKLNMAPHPWRKSGTNIVICCQHECSEQWNGMPPTIDYVKGMIDRIRKHSDRPIVVRPHPRYPIDSFHIDGVKIDTPKKIAGSYDSCDFVRVLDDAYCIISHNGNCAYEAVLNGVPIITSNSSLAFPMSNQIENLESLVYPDREPWLIDISHTEWRFDELHLAWAGLRDALKV